MGVLGGWKKVAVAAGMVATLTVGAGVGAIAQSGEDNAGAPPVPEGRVGAASPTETVFVPIVPCRLFSSVPVGGKFNPGETRSINKGGNLATQGGKPGGCGIPNGATALEVNITAPLAEGTGYVRTWPDESVEQGATFMNFTNHFNVSNAGTVDVDKGSTDVMDLKVYNRRTHVIIDVNGYYVDGLVAVVNANGTLARGNGVVSTATAVGVGEYVVTFERNVSGCAFTANRGQTANSGEAPPGDVTVAGAVGNTDGVYLQVTNAAGADQAGSFHLQVQC